MKKKIIALFILCFVFNIFMLNGCKEKEHTETDNDPQPLVQKDETAPLIQTYFEEQMVIEIGTKVDLRSDIVGLDNVDGNITDKIIIDDGGFNANMKGIYTIYYSLKDSSGNYATSKYRTIMVIDSNNALLIAHRGGKGKGLENTIEAFQNAIELGYYGVECDVQETSDGVLVVYHDLNISRLTGIDMNVKNATWEYLSSLTYTKKETDGVTYTGHMLLFKDYLKLVKSSKTKAFIELKETCTEDTLKHVMEEINEVGLDESQYVIIANSSSLHLLVSLRKISATIKLQFVARTEYQNYIKTCIDNKIDLDVSTSVFSDNYDEALNYVKMFLNNDLEINVWVCNKESEIKKFMGLGVTYFTTDTLVPTK